LSGCVLQDTFELLAKRSKLIRTLWRDFEFRLFPNEDVPHTTPQLHAKIPVDDVRRRGQHAKATRGLLTQNDSAIASSQTQRALVRRNCDWPKSGCNQFLQNLHLTGSEFEHQVSTRQRRIDVERKLFLEYLEVKPLSNPPENQMKRPQAATESHAAS
jgi:hypothetical protein